MSKRNLKHWLKAQEANSATEFALVLPLLVVLMFAFVEIGRLIWSYNIVNSAVRDSSRYAARLSMTCAGFSDTGNEAIVKRLTRTGTVDTGGTPLLPSWTSDTTVQINFGCVSNSSGAYKGLYEGMTDIPTVTVIANAPYSAGVGGAMFSSLGFTTMSARHSQVWTQQ